MGLSIGEIQQWNYAAMMQGVSAETLAGVLNKLGSGKFDKGLADLGISTKDTTGELRNSTDILEDVADSLLAIENPAERNRKAVAVLGKSYATMLPLLADGSKGIKELREEFDALGGGFTPEFAKQADEFGDNVDRVKTIWKNLSITVVGKVLPMFVEISKKAVAVVKPLMLVTKNSKVLEAGAGALAIKGFLVLSRTIGPLNVALRGLIFRVLPLVAAFLLFEDALTFLSGGDSLIGRAIDSWFGKGAQDKVRAFFGDIDAQSKMSMDPKAGFGANLTGTALLMAQVFKQMGNSADDFYRVVDGVWRGIVLSAGIAWEVLRKGWASVGASISDAVTDPIRAKKNADIEAEAQNIERNGSFGTPSMNEAAKARANALRATKEKSQSEINEQYSSQQQAKLLADYEKIATQLDPKTHNPAYIAAQAAKADSENAAGTRYRDNGTPMTNITTVNVTVEPGTPAQVKKDVGAAAAAGVVSGINMQAQKAAVSPGKG